VTDMMTNPPTGPLVLNLRLAMAQRP
jgi:hypothetical protein